MADQEPVLMYTFSRGLVPSHGFVFRVCRGLQLNCSLFSLKKVGKTTFTGLEIYTRPLVFTSSLCARNSIEKRSERVLQAPTS